MDEVIVHSLGVLELIVCFHILDISIEYGLELQKLEFYNLYMKSNLTVPLSISMQADTAQLAYQLQWARATYFFAVQFPSLSKGCSACLSGPAVLCGGAAHDGREVRAVKAITLAETIVMLCYCQKCLVQGISGQKLFPSFFSSVAVLSCSLCLLANSWLQVADEKVIWPIEHTKYVK